MHADSSFQRFKDVAEIRIRNSPAKQFYSDTHSGMRVTEVCCCRAAAKAIIRMTSSRSAASRVSPCRSQGRL